MVDFGAIRWDAYWDNAPNTAARWTEEALGPQRHRHRTPLHGVEVNPNRIRWDATQARIDAEITAAAAGGLDYWAFLRYNGVNSPSNSVLNAAWDLFQTSSIKNNIKWATMQQYSTLGSWNASPAYATEVAQIVSWMQQPNYKKVLGNRPLMYFLTDPASLDLYWNGDVTRAKTAIDAIRSGVITAGLGDPYLVTFQIGSIGASNAARVALGGQAITEYAVFLGPPNRGSYLDLDMGTRAYWPSMAAISPKIVPLCMMGWPPLPIKERPGPWFAPPYNNVRPYFGMLNIWTLPTTTELTTHFDACEAYINANPVVCESNCALIYAWNENTEGGWLVPTYGQPNGERLGALYTALHN